MRAPALAPAGVAARHPMARPLAATTHMMQRPRVDPSGQIYEPEPEPVTAASHPQQQTYWDENEYAQQPDPQDDADAQWARRYLAVHEVEKSFGGRKVVKGVSLYLRPGEAVGLLGPNGAGKTTVFYMITGLVKADHGRIVLDGHDITGLPMYQHGRLGIGYLPQEA